MIPQSFIDDLLQRVDVVEVVGRHVKLKKGGANYSGLCPFHNEKSPSFTVSPTKQFYHCFGCGAHGTALGFLIEYSGMSFPDAVRDLAQAVGMVVPETRPGVDLSRKSEGHADGGEPFDDSKSRITVIIDALEAANGFYRNALRGSQRAIDYLKGRGLTGEVAARFALGYAPDGWQNLEEAFDDYRSPVLADAGLVIIKGDEEGSQGRAYDRFRDRVMFPIRNSRGRVIGFGGRVLDVGEPKYLNSPETPVFQKGQELYGLFEARQSIREAGFALVVEGYMDVVALAQHGVANAVATLGTACTPTHVQKLLRQTERVTFSFDGDAAGQKAAWRALEASLPLATDDKALTFLSLPPEHDPDSYIREHGRDAFLDAVRGALPLSEYALREVARTNDLRTAEGRAKALFDARPLVKALPLGALRMQIIRSLSGLTGASVDEIAESFQIATAASPKRARPRRVEREAPQGLSHRALTALMMYPVHAHALTASDLTTLEEGAGDARDLILEVVDAAKAEGRDVDFVMMSDALRESPNREIYESLMQEILAYDENKRDLLMRGATGDGPGDEDALEARRQEQKDLKARELRDAIRRMREQAIATALAALSVRGLRDATSVDAYRRLVEERDRLRQSGDDKGQ